MAKFIVDIECLRGIMGSMVVKELAIVEATNASGIQSWLFKEPYPETCLSKSTIKTNKWLENNLHAISWNDGDVEYSQLHSILHRYISPGSTVYAKGREKCQLIAEILSVRVINIESLGCPKSADIFLPLVTCFHHHINHQKNQHCAFYKALKFCNWLRWTFVV